jgi:hypothetical protein
MSNPIFGQHSTCDVCGRPVLVLPHYKTGEQLVVELRPITVFTRNLNGTLCPMEAHQHHSVKCKGESDE